jgi:hypothetical protein
VLGVDDVLIAGHVRGRIHGHCPDVPVQNGLEEGPGMETRRSPELLQKYGTVMTGLTLNMAPANNRSYVLQPDTVVEQTLGGFFFCFCQAFVLIAWRAHRTVVRTSWNLVLFLKTKRPIFRTRVRLEYPNRIASD